MSAPISAPRQDSPAPTKARHAPLPRSAPPLNKFYPKSKLRGVRNSKPANAKAQRRKDAKPIIFYPLRQFGKRRWYPISGHGGPTLASLWKTETSLLFSPCVKK
jgi:hypothetical protein